MIRTGEQYRDSVRDGRRIWIDGERVTDITRHPMCKPLVDIRPVMTYSDEHGRINGIANKLPATPQDWHDKRCAVETVLDEIAGVVTRVGNETVGESWPLYDGQDVLNEVNPRFAENIRMYVQRVIECDPFHVCVTPDAATFRNVEAGPWLEKFYTVNGACVAEDGRKLLAFARDLLNSDYAGHRLTFQLFAQSPPYAHLAAGLSERVTGRRP